MAGADEQQCQDLFMKLKGLQLNLGRDPTAEEVAHHLGWDIDLVDKYFFEERADDEPSKAVHGEILMSAIKEHELRQAFFWGGRHEYICACGPGAKKQEAEGCWDSGALASTNMLFAGRLFFCLGLRPAAAKSKPSSPSKEVHALLY